MIKKKIFEDEDNSKQSLATHCKISDKKKKKNHKYYLKFWAGVIVIPEVVQTNNLFLGFYQHFDQEKLMKVLARHYDNTNINLNRSWNGKIKQFSER